MAEQVRMCAAFGAMRRALFSTWIAVVAFVGAAACTATAGAATHARIDVDQPVALIDTPLTIRVAGLRANSTVTVAASAVVASQQYTSSAQFKTDNHGVIDLTSAAPLARSSYNGADPMGLFWSLDDPHPTAGTGPTDRAIITLTVTAAGRHLASTDITRLFNAPGEQQRPTTIESDGFVGRYYTPANATHRPAVVVFGGSEGGLAASPRLAANLAAHGYPTLALAYFGLPGLPSTLSNIPLEYFTKAAAWLAGQPEVDHTKVWLMSGSRGSEAAMLVAAHFPSLVHGVIVEAPSAYSYSGLDGGPGWTLGGHALPAAAFDLAGTTRGSDGLHEVLAFTAGLSDPATQAAAIPVENIGGPILTIAGGDDQLWPSTIYAQRIHGRLDAHHFAHTHQILVYPAAGHLVFGPPFTPAPDTTIQQRGRTLALGGTRAADEAAHQDAWPKALAFIANN